MEETIIKVVNAVKKFKNHTVLNQVSMECHKNEIVGIIGRNGSGKTVLMKCICGYYLLNEGEIYINEKLRVNKSEMIKNAGVIIEEPAFLGNVNAMKNLSYLYEINNKFNRKYLEEIIEFVGLDPKEKKHVSNYSMGMKQRLAIAQAIMENPDILILDEPMNGLDNSGVDDIRKLLLKRKAMGNTILIASHNREDIEILCDSVYEMDKGEIKKQK